MPPHHRMPVILAAGLLLIANAGASAQPEVAATARVREDLAKLRVQQLQLAAELAVVKEELTVLNGEPEKAVPPSLAIPDGYEDFAKVARRLYETSHDSFKNKLAALAAGAEADRRAAVGALQDATAVELEAAAMAAHWETVSNAGTVGGYWDANTWALYGSCIAFLAVGLALVAHEARVRVRRYLRGREFASTLLLGLLVPLAVAAETLPNLARSWDGEKKKLDKDIATIQAELKDELSKRDALRLKRGPVEWRAVVEAATRGSNGEEILRAGDAVFQPVHDYLVSRKVAELASQATAKSLEKASEYRRSLNASGFVDAGTHVARLGLRAGIVLGLVAGVFGLLYLVRWRRRRQMAKNRIQCPSCLAAEPGDLERRPAANPDPRYPIPDQMVCRQCGYRFRSDYLDFLRLCFPYVGVRSSGKTHSLLVVYDRIKSHRIAGDTELRKLPSMDIENEFDQQMLDLLRDNQGPNPNIFALPRPLTLFARDTDKLGRNAALVNLFDYSGELMDQSVQTSVIRRRACQGDGFILYLDPTQATQTRANLGLKPQVEAIEQFYDDLRGAHGVKEGRSVKLPIAVCLSKLDLWVSDTEFGQNARTFVAELRKTENAPPTLELLQERSQQCERVLSILFPGWDVRKMLRKMFGRQIMFFPVTPVNIVDAELGEKDLTKRVYRPFGTVEPLLWLLHMSGYNVLPAKA